MAGAVVAFRVLQSILLPLMFAILLAALLSPVVDRLDRHVRHGLSVTLVLVAFLGIVIGAFAYVVPTLVAQAGDAISEMQRGLQELPRLAGSVGLDRAETQDILQTTTDRLRQNVGGIGAQVSQQALGVAATTLAVGFGGFLTVVLLAYLLVDGRTFYRGALRLVHVEHRAQVQEATTRAWHALVVFIRSQVFVAMFDAAGIALGLALLGVPLVLPLAVLTFFLCFIPFVGAVLSGGVVALVALSTQGVGAALGMIAIAGLVQFAEGNFVYPLIIGRSLSLHPITVLLTVGTGSALLGVLGAFFATPVLAAVAAGLGYLPDPAGDETEAPAIVASEAALRVDEPADPAAAAAATPD